MAVRTHLDVAQLGYVELLTPKFEESLEFFTNILSMQPVESSGDSVYLRTWDDYEKFSLKLTAHQTSGVGQIGLRPRVKPAFAAWPTKSPARAPEGSGREASRDEETLSSSPIRTVTGWTFISIPRSSRHAMSKSPRSRIRRSGGRTTALAFAGSITSTTSPGTSRRIAISWWAASGGYSPSRFR